MRRGQTRLALPALLLLLSVACTPNSGDATSDQSRAQAEPEAAQPTEQAEPAAGTEAALAPREAEQPAAPGTAVAPADRTTTRQSAPAAAPRAPRPPDAPAAPPSDDAVHGSATTPARDARNAGAREALPDVPRPAPTRMISIPAETRLTLVLQDAVASDTSAVEDRVNARVANDVIVEGTVVIPEGSRVAGRVTYAQPSGKVKGRAGLTVRFHTLTVGSRTYDIAAEPLRREAAGTKAKDARDIGIGAGAGAVIGGIIGGRKGAGIGAAVGGAGGAGKVLATSGEEVRLAAGTSVTTRLAEPLVVEATRTGPR